MAEKQRNQLYPEFANGQKPDEQDFRNLIDSFYNKLDDQSISLKSNSGDESILLSGRFGSIALGRGGQDGEINIYNRDSARTIRIWGDRSEMEFYKGATQRTIQLSGSTGQISLGGSEENGYLFLKNEDGRTSISIGSENNNGKIHFYKDSDINKKIVELNGENGNLTLGGGGQDGDLILRNGTGSTSIHLSGITSNPNQRGFIKLFNSSGTTISLYGSNGNAYKVNGGEWSNISSDKRVKKGIKPYKKGLTELKSLNPVTYKYNGKAGTIDDSKTYCGFIAQDVMEEFPEMVFTRLDKLNKDDEKEIEIYGIDTSDIKYVLINAVRELAAKVEKLEVQLSK